MRIAAAFARRQPQVDATRIVAIGQSYGGAISIALAARNPPGLVAAINFAGGGGGDPQTRPGEPCEPFRLAQMFGDYGRSAKVPTLWIYTENDRYFAPRHARNWHDAFRAQGGAGELLLLPAFGEDGHQLFARGRQVWQSHVQPFLTSHIPTTKMRAR